MHAPAIVRRLLLACLLPAACTAPVGVTGLEIPADGLAQCESQCGTMGMRAGAVVAMAGRIGCVCETKETSANPDRHTASLAGGMAAIVIQEDQERAEEQRRQQQLR